MFVINIFIRKVVFKMSKSKINNTLVKSPSGNLFLPEHLPINFEELVAKCVVDDLFHADFEIADNKYNNGQKSEGPDLQLHMHAKNMCGIEVVQAIHNLQHSIDQKKKHLNQKDEFPRNCSFSDDCINCCCFDICQKWYSINKHHDFSFHCELIIEKFLNKIEKLNNKKKYINTLDFVYDDFIFYGLYVVSHIHNNDSYLDMLHLQRDLINKQNHMLKEKKYSRYYSFVIVEGLDNIYKFSLVNPDFIPFFNCKNVSDDHTLFNKLSNYKNKIQADIKEQLKTNEITN